MYGIKRMLRASLWSWSRTRTLIQVGRPVSRAHGPTRTVPAALSRVLYRLISTTPTHHVKLQILYVGWKGLVWGIRMLNTPLARAGSMISKKIIWLWKLPADERKDVWHSVSAKRKIFYVVSTVLSLLATAFYYEHVEETPITKRRRFIVLTREQVDTMVNTEKDNILSTMAAKGTLLPDTHLKHQLVLSIVTQLTANAPPPDQGTFQLNYQVHVFENPDLVSAFCLPSGDLIVFTGLIDACSNREELSFVLGHELAHSMLAHKTEHLSRWAIINYFTDFLKEFWEVAESQINSFQPLRLFQNKVTEVLLTYPYSEEMEMEADKVGLIMAARACYDPVKGCGVWTNLTGVEAKGEKKVEYLTLHPCDARRHGNIAGLVSEACVVWKASGCGQVANMSTATKK